jgi:hypothetical protein
MRERRRVTIEDDGSAEGLFRQAREATEQAREAETARSTLREVADLAIRDVRTAEPDANEIVAGNESIQITKRTGRRTVNAQKLLKAGVSFEIIEECTDVAEDGESLSFRQLGTRPG